MFAARFVTTFNLVAICTIYVIGVKNFFFVPLNVLFTVYYYSFLFIFVFFLVTDQVAE